MILAHLVPGDITDLGQRSAVFIDRHQPHPFYPDGFLALATWRLDDGSYSFDALDPRQDVGEVRSTTIETRRAALAWGLGRYGVPSPFEVDDE
jgi:hypothetical protein